jgi:hypothetical protein
LKKCSKNEFSQFIEVEEREKIESQIERFIKQESEMNEILMVSPMDVCKSAIDLVLFKKKYHH